MSQECSTRSEASRILRFWHTVEFFIPFDLQQVLEAEDAEWAVRGWSQKELRQSGCALWKPNVPADRRLTGFDVYFGIFDRSVMSEVVQETLTPQQILDQDERGELEGLTCIAKVKADSSGEPLFDDVSVSTAPWALGCIQRGGLGALDFDDFEQSVEELKLRLQQFRARRRAAEDLADEDEGAKARAPRAPLSAEELQSLLVMFQDWASCQISLPASDSHMLVVRAKSVENRPKKEEAVGGQVTKEEHSDGMFSNGPEAEDDDMPEDEEDEADIEIDILNSFFAKDIARAIKYIEGGEICPALAAYLTPLHESERLDLYSVAGRARILNTLSLDHLPLAHWPDEPAHAMSLMQQFAINSTLSELKEGAVFSVNGPPGTGKTTLLRDIFAELITQRARVLAGLTTPQDAFGKAMTVKFRDGDSCRISLLRKDLTGYEMVVTSSNNAAVENLSRDLPKAEALGEETWRDKKGNPKVQYLQPVANNIVARTAKGDYRTLEPKDTPWGLISCALGRARNRREFAARLTSAGKKNDLTPARGFNPRRHQSLWTWRESVANKLSFAAARDAFGKADQAVRQRIDQLDRYATVRKLVQGKTFEIFIAEAQAAAEQAGDRIASAEAELNAVEAEGSRCGSQMAILREQARLIEASRPVWWRRWPPSEQSRQYQQDRARNHRQQQDLLSRLYHVQEQQPIAEGKRREAKVALAAAELSLASRMEEWQTLQRELTALEGVFPDVRFPETAEELEQEHWQINGLWRDGTFNRLRSHLFVAALGLHEAWLADVLQKGHRFGGNVIAIERLLSGNRPLDSKDALAIWQSLFMIVPVVSSTFASITRQFRDLGANSLGWLFIDEAGQAVPQAAVGALWRSKRAVVVGDPLQIEPVFTVPIKLSEALAAEAGLSPEAKVAPHEVSAQILADAANNLGAWIPTPDGRQWIGSPLRVHRRCVDPMFTIANTIAYQNRMIFPYPDHPERRRPPVKSLDVGPSAWVCIGGTATDKQVVPAQVDLVCQAVRGLYRRLGCLPDLYVISPFRRVKQAVIERLNNPDHWPSQNRPATTVLRTWCRERIGTVHTFQGKEESLVWMVLGCDKETAGAAAWAAKKPNILNVAVTRAKHRFFMIGSESLWAGRSHFCDASSDLLPRITPDVFLSRVLREPAEGEPTSKSIPLFEEGGRPG